MADKKSIYIGEFPPPYGGVTVKNAILYENVFKAAGTERIDLQEYRRSPLSTPATLFRLSRGMIGAQAVIIGTGAVWRDKLLLAVQRILTGKRGLKKTAKIVMGGRYHELVKNDPALRRLLSQAGSVWVESESMVRAFHEMGIPRTYFFPNCRVDEGAREPRPFAQETGLKLVFFSKICKEKGVDIIMKAFESLQEKKASVSLDFYGEISANIKDSFEKFTGGGYASVRCHGVFDAVNHDVYKELNQYDIMLLPTRWEGEGVSGALIESKMAGITAIVSDWHVNGETVRDGQEGIVLKSTTPEELAETIAMLCEDPAKVQALKAGAFASRKRYCIETYRQALIDKTLG